MFVVWQGAEIISHLKKELFKSFDMNDLDLAAMVLKFKPYVYKTENGNIQSFWSWTGPRSNGNVSFKFLMNLI